MFLMIALIKDLRMVLEVNLEISLTFMVSGSGTVYGSYQHASTATTLAESKKYTISSSGYGRVINFDASVRNKYAAMTGVDLSF